MVQHINYTASVETQRTIDLTLSIECLPADGDIKGLVERLAEDNETLWLSDEDRMQVIFEDSNGNEVKSFSHSNWDTSENFC